MLELRDVRKFPEIPIDLIILFIKLQPDRFPESVRSLRTCGFTKKNFPVTAMYTSFQILF